MFTKSAQFYDAIYAAHGKNYEREAFRLRELIETHKQSSGRQLLDVACGTGAHARLLATWYEVQGLDVDEQMLEVARRRCPGMPLHLADMRSFDLGQTFDAVLCLFSSIGYARNPQGLEDAIGRMTVHLRPGGVLLVEPWILPDQFKAGTPHALLVNQPELKIARLTTSRVCDRLSIIEFHYLVAAASGIEHLTENHELFLFTDAEYRGALTRAGLAVTVDEQGLMGRGLYIGVKPAR